ncbi:MAG: acyl-CoA dehydrogenase [Candidatus Thermoplasmatota archaeon]|jgi:butyryl-CoA dehydrogenase|nr:acyl-CoA dehydrogenase [Candidatus Thermoplasmatota archaeon]MDP7264131.1 acyl-CoA dehydrogenase [Candidatus Thermoplasmatota archaeon]
MDFRLNDEQEMIRSAVRELALNDIEPIAKEIDAESRHPAETIKKLAEMGIMGMMVSEEYGGSGSDAISYAIAVEEISRVCGSTGIIVSVNNSLACYPIEKFGTDDQKNKFLTPLASGAKLGAFGLTEPSAGTDAGSQRTVAQKEDGHYIINGSKIFITNGPVADTLVIFAMTDKSAGMRGITAFIIEKGMPGFSIGTEEDKLGIRGSQTGELVFQNLIVPEENRLWDEGRGFSIAMQTLDCGRIGVAAQALGIAQGALDRSVQYAKERVQFGKPIGKFQAISFMLADMETRVQAARYLVYSAAFAKDNQKKYSKEAAMAKLYAAETAMDITTKAIQIHGGYGYTKDYPVERYFRDAKITEIYEGTSEVMKMVISRALGL